MSDIPVYTREQVVAEAERQFGKDAAKAIMHLLDQYPVPRGQGSAAERVQMAILKLAKGDLDTLRHYLKQAKDDFRDVLFWAEHFDK